MAESVLEIHQHPDFTIYVSSAKARALYRQALRRYELRQATSYTFPAGAAYIPDFESEDEAAKIFIQSGEQQPPVFFENTSYIFEIEFNQKQDSTPYIYHHRKDINEQFNYRNNRLYGSINFGNDIGKFGLGIRYSTDHVLKEYLLGFEVLPVKLNYKRDYTGIVENIQQEYPLLVLDFFKKTFAGLHEGDDLKHDFIWWHVFQEICAGLFKEAELIIHKPHNRLLRKTFYVKRDRLTRLDPWQEEAYMQHQHKPGHYFEADQKILSADTPENRFVKYALKDTRTIYRRLFLYIEKKHSHQLSEQARLQFQQQLLQLNSLLNHPLWKSVGDFTGIKQESTAIQGRPGYSGFYRKYLLLKQGVSFFEDSRSIEFKNVSELYQIWCFIEMKNLISDITNVKPDVSFKQKFEYRRWYSLRVDQAFSCFTYHLGNGDRVELLHDYSYKKDDNDEQNVLRSYTEEQRPDITLRIIKADIPNHAILTYLFDAKYQVKTLDGQHLDAPHPDAMNQMHRYRDALYHKTRNHFDQAEKGVIGGYILFPGEGENEEILAADYYRAIEKVNIGAFPLNISNPSHKTVLRRFLEEKIMGASLEGILKQAPAQKYVMPQFPDGLVLIGRAKSDEQEKYLLADPSIYYMPIPKGVDYKMLEKIRYFSHWRKTGECVVIYRVEPYKTYRRSDLSSIGYPFHKSSKERCLVLKLYEPVALPHAIKSSPGNHYVRYCSVSDFLKARSFDDFVM